MPQLQLSVPRGQSIQPGQLTAFISRACPATAYSGRRVLILVPGAVRPAPIGLMFKTLYRQLNKLASGIDLMLSRGAHPPMTEEAISQRLDISPRERKTIYQKVKFFDHEWERPGELRLLGRIPAREIGMLSKGLFAMDVPVMVNRNVFDYDILLIVGPVFPHEVVGFSGGNKYLFPGLGDPEFLNFSHWIGAIVTSPMMIGNKWTPVRQLIDKAAAMVPTVARCFSLVVDGPNFAGITYGDPKGAWELACNLARDRHTTILPNPFPIVVSCVPAAYRDLWEAGECAPQLEQVVADGGELILYAPHIHEISEAFGRPIKEVGYHCRDFFVRQWDQFKGYPWGILAHCARVRGIGSYENGVEQFRIGVTLATGIPPELCARLHLGYRDPASINLEDCARLEDAGLMLVRPGGDQLYRLETTPPWANREIN